MVTSNPRIQVMLDKETNELLKAFAGRRSVSSAAAILIKEALELHEEFVLSEMADARFSAAKKWIKHEDVWN